MLKTVSLTKIEAVSLAILLEDFHDFVDKPRPLSNQETLGMHGRVEEWMAIIGGKIDCSNGNHEKTISQSGNRIACKRCEKDFGWKCSAADFDSAHCIYGAMEACMRCGQPEERK